MANVSKQENQAKPFLAFSFSFYFYYIVYYHDYIVVSYVIGTSEESYNKD